MKLTVYIAGLITNRTFNQVTQYFNNTSDILRHMGYDTYIPMIKREKMALGRSKRFKPTGYTDPELSDSAITRRDRWMIDKSDIVYCNLLQAEEKSIGCSGELTMSWDKKKHVIVIMEKKNLHRHAFIKESADIIFETESEALDYLQGLADDLNLDGGYKLSNEIQELKNSIKNLQDQITMLVSNKR